LKRALADDAGVLPFTEAVEDQQSQNDDVREVPEFWFQLFEFARRCRIDIGARKWGCIRVS
jgi:hypothetical protein